MFKKAKLGIFAALAGAMAMVSNVASAAIAATDLSTALTQVTTDSQTVFDAVLPILLGVLALTVGMKLVKRFTNKI